MNYRQIPKIVVDWLYGDGENCAKDEYKNRINEF